MGGFADIGLRRAVLVIATGIVVGLAAARVVGVIVEDLVMPIVAAVTPDPASFSLGIWRLRWPLGHLLQGLLEFAATVGVVIAIVKTRLGRLHPSQDKVCPDCREWVHPEASRCRFCRAPLASGKDSAAVQEHR